MQEERRLAVLRAIVEDYVETHEPVGSKALVERHRLGVSPATIRNDMAVLEEEGLIAQPHTSAGRIPTDMGYRVFVDRLTEVKPMSAGERRAISAFLAGAVDLDDVVQRSVRLLAQLTQQVAIVQYPTLSGSTVRHVELVALTPVRLLVVAILSTGRVEQRLVEAPGADLDDTDVARMRAALLAQCIGRTVADAVVGLEMADHADPVLTRVTDTLVDALRDHRSDERVVVGGTANLTRFGDSFESSVKPLLEALEEHVVLLKLLGEASTSPTLTVRIGAEGPLAQLASTSVVASGYGPGDSLAALGIVGPTRMDYPGTMAAVRAVARYVSTILDET